MATAQPAFVFLSTTDWDAPQFGSRQQIALRLAERGHVVLFTEVPRALHSLVSDPSGTWRAARRLGRTRQVEERLLVYTPLPVLPLYYNAWTNAVNQRLLLLYLRRLLRRLGLVADVLWTYWPNTAYLVSRLGSRVSVYHCIDDFAAAGYPLTSRESIAAMEAEQCRQVDLVVTRTEQMCRTKRRFNANTHVLPGGVDVEQFNPMSVGAPPQSVDDLPRPRVGFVGTIDDRVDVELLVHCAERLAEVTFILVGPVKRHRVRVQSLSGLANVHLLPASPHSAVPAIVGGFDVCLIPYAVNDYTRGLSPLKLYEYLAMGKPVVATRLPYVEREASSVRIASSCSEFVAAVEDAMATALAGEPRPNSTPGPSRSTRSSGIWLR
jgi:glycosyltransferase involved in cell wall biosynthesis